jgi:hypothetical protein
MLVNTRSHVKLRVVISRALVVALGGLAMLVALPTGALAGKPDREVTPFSADAIVDSCGFPVRLQVEGTEHALNFGDRLGFTYAATKATLTNLETGASIRIAIPGPEFVQFNDDGTVTVSGPGPWLWARSHPVTLEPGIWLTHGLIIRSFENREPISIEQHGTSENLCNALA